MMKNNFRKNLKKTLEKSPVERNREVCRENHQIVCQNSYKYGERKVYLKHTLVEHQAVKVLSPEKIKAIEMEMKNEKMSMLNQSLGECEIQVVNVDSFYYKTDLVMNFANAVHPGGGYLNGAVAQEECLCRESTLYASISSKAAKEMYTANQMNQDMFDTDYMLLSPCVEVFRNASNELLEEPYSLAVMTIAAPNLFGRAREAQIEDVKEYMKKRIRQYLKCGVYFGYQTITLGAWGCGAFGNDAGMVADCFKEVLIDEEYCKYYRKILFAVYDNTYEMYNYLAFKNAFCV